MKDQKGVRVPARDETVYLLAPRGAEVWLRVLGLHNIMRAMQHPSAVTVQAKLRTSKTAHIISWA